MPPLSSSFFFLPLFACYSLEITGLAAVATTTILSLTPPSARAFFVPSSLGYAHACSSEGQSSWATRSSGTDVGSRLLGSSVASSRVPEPDHHLPQDRPECAHLYGYGDPDHVPSTLQNITAQRYLGARVYLFLLVAFFCFFCFTH